MTWLLQLFFLTTTVSSVTLAATSCPVATPDDYSPAETSEDPQALASHERFLSLLRKQPRPGTALDRVYGFHIERGTLDEFIASLNAEASAADEQGAAALLLGLLELQRGHEKEAAAALRGADERRPDDPIAAWSLARALMRLGQADAAAEALERAIQRAPAKADLLQIYQELGRAYRRSQQPKKAAEVWTRMEVQFPDDLRVKEQIAAIQFEEGDFEAALGRYSELASLHTDPYQAADCAITAGDLKLKLGRRAEALRDFENQLVKLDPQSWLWREARRRIEDVFLRTDDFIGLITYYESWLRTHPEDVDAMSRVGRALAQQGRFDDARTWYEKALQRAPSDIGLRESLIEQFVREEKYAEAIFQYEQLHRYAPGNSDHIEEWGLLS